MTVHIHYVTPGSHWPKSLRLESVQTVRHIADTPNGATVGITTFGNAETVHTRVERIETEYF